MYPKITLAGGGSEDLPVGTCGQMRSIPFQAKPANGPIVTDVPYAGRDSDSKITSHHNPHHTQHNTVSVLKL